MENLIEQLLNELIQHADEKTKTSSQRFFKETIASYGVKTAVVQDISKEFYKHLSSSSKAEIFDSCELLFKTGMLEASFVACNWSWYAKKKYEITDNLIFESWIVQYVNNWATCDTLCNHTVGTLIEKYPEHLQWLKRIALSDNRWMRRAAAVSLIVPARKGLFLKEILEIADLLLTDPDDLVQKGYGWMLKAASQSSESYQQTIFEYVVRNKSQMPRTALRYAIEKMPTEMKAEAMAK